VHGHGDEPGHGHGAPVQAALRADIRPSVGQDRHELPRRQGRELGPVAGEQDPLALLVSQAKRDQALAAFAAIQAVLITCEPPPPALQRGEAHAQQYGHLLGPCTGRHDGIEDFQCLAAILGRGQSPTSSPK